MARILIDVGGTDLKFTYSHHDTIAHPMHTCPSLAKANQETIIQNFCHVVLQMQKDAQCHTDCTTIEQICMAFPGPFDYEHGISLMQGLSKYDSIFGISLPDAMNQYFRSIHSDLAPEYFFVHDVEAYARGICNVHALQNQKVIYLCIGTGAGSAYSDHGTILKNGPGVPDHGWFYNLPFLDKTIDDYISVRGIKALALDFMHQDLTPLEISLLAKDGNTDALQVYRKFGENLEQAMLTPIAQFHPDCFVLGGNISRSSQLFIEPLKTRLTMQNIKLYIEPDTSEYIFSGLSSLT